MSALVELPAEAADAALMDASAPSWLFTPTSKTGRRSWCGRRSCGNRAKAEPHRRPTRRPPTLQRRTAATGPPAIVQLVSAGDSDEPSALPARSGPGIYRSYNS